MSVGSTARRIANAGAIALPVLGCCFLAWRYVELRRVTVLQARSMEALQGGALKQGSGTGGEGGIALVSGKANAEGAGFRLVRSAVLKNPRAASNGCLLELLRLHAAELPDLDASRRFLTILTFPEDCVGCLREAPAWQRYWDEGRGRGVHVIGVMGGLAPEAARQVAAQMGLRFPVYADPERRLGALCSIEAGPFKIVQDSGANVLFAGASFAFEQPQRDEAKGFQSLFRLGVRQYF